MLDHFKWQLDHAKPLTEVTLAQLPKCDMFGALFNVGDIHVTIIVLPINSYCAKRGNLAYIHVNSIPLLATKFTHFQTTVGIPRLKPIG